MAASRIAKKKAPTKDDLGRAAYNAYCSMRGWKSVYGDKIPSWDDSIDQVKKAWIAGAQAAVALHIAG